LAGKGYPQIASTVPVSVLFELLTSLQ